MKTSVMNYFEEKVVPHIEPDQHTDSVAQENELEGFINAVIDAVETGKMPKVRIVKVSSVSTYVCTYF